MIDMELDMQIVFERMCIDENYWDAVLDLPDSHWIHQSYKCRKKSTQEYQDLLKEHAEDELHAFGKNLKYMKYPLQIIDPETEKLNATGHQMLQNYYDGDIARTNLSEFADKKDGEWRTFRDVVPTKVKSIFTGTSPTPLKGRWVDLDENDC